MARTTVDNDVLERVVELGSKNAENQEKLAKHVYDLAKSTHHEEFKLAKNLAINSRLTSIIYLIGAIPLFLIGFVTILMNVLVVAIPALAIAVICVFNAARHSNKY